MAAQKEDLRITLNLAGRQIGFGKEFLRLVRASGPFTEDEANRLVVLATAIAEHEVHRYPDFNELLEVVCAALHRVSRDRKSGAYHLPVEYVTELQDAGLTIARALDALKWLHEGFLRWKREVRCEPATEERDTDMYWQAVRELIAALKGPWGAALLLQPKCLRIAIRCAWHCRMRQPEDFRGAFGIAAAYDEFGFDESELMEIFSGAQYGGMVGFGIGLSMDAITKPEVLAIVRSGTGIRGLPPEEQVRLINAAVAIRGQVRPERFLRTATALGIEAAAALHALTDDPSLAMRANAVRERRGWPLSEYLAAYADLRALPMSFEQFVMLTERWDLPALRAVATTYPDATLLCRLTKIGLVSAIARAAVVGIPQAALARFEGALLRYLKPRPDAEWCDAARAFEQWNGNAERSDAYLALPATLRDHPVISTLAERGDDVVLRDQQLLKLVVTVADAGHVVDLELLREFQRVGTWPNSRSMALVYGIALQFRTADEMVDAAVRRAAEAFDRLSPRKCARAIRDQGYFRYAVLGEQRAAAAAEPTSVGSDRELAAPTPSGIKRVRRPSGPVVANDAAPPAGVVPLTDLRTLHAQLDLRGLVPARVDAETVTALIVYGLCDLGKASPYAGNNGLPERHVLRNTSRKYSSEPDVRERAWQWLQAVGIAVHPRGRGNQAVFALDLGDAHDRPEAREIARRTRSFLTWFQEQTRR